MPSLSGGPTLTRGKWARVRVPWARVSRSRFNITSVSGFNIRWLEWFYLKDQVKLTNAQHFE